MDEASVDNALSLGSSEDFYEKGTLSKFGMGLKSAASSLGRRLEIVTRKENGESLKAVLDQDLIYEHGSYVYEFGPANDKEVKILNQFTGNDKSAGTIVSISKIHHESMPSVAEIISGLPPEKFNEASADYTD